MRISDMTPNIRPCMYSIWLSVSITCMLSGCTSTDSLWPRSLNPFSDNSSSNEMMIYGQDADVTASEHTTTVSEEKPVTADASASLSDTQQLSSWFKSDDISENKADAVTLNDKAESKPDNAEITESPAKSLWRPLTWFTSNKSEAYTDITPEINADAAASAHAASVMTSDDDMWRKHRLATDDGVIEVLSPGGWNAKEVKRREDAGYLSAMIIPERGDPDAPRHKIHVRYRSGDKNVTEKAQDLKRAIKLFCGEDHVRVLVPEAKDNTLMLLRLCGNMSGGMTESHGLSAYGEVSLMYLIQENDGIYSVSHDWKVPAYDANSDAALFAAVPERTLQYHAAALKRTRVCAAEEECR